MSAEGQGEPVGLAEYARVYAAAYIPSVEDLRRGLPEIGAGIHCQLDELWARPSAMAAEVVAANLDGARRACLRFREALLREGEGHVR